ncbi:MAG: hypothetical protein ACC742_05380 [Thermoanaerobaculales bacterium]
MRPLPKGSRLEGIPALRLIHQIWGAERTVVLFISAQLRDGQILHLIPLQGRADLQPQTLLSMLVVLRTLSTWNPENSLALR